MTRSTWTRYTWVMGNSAHYRKRKSRIEFVAEHEEKERWEEQAEKAGVSLGQLIRFALDGIEKITITRKAA